MPNHVVPANAEAMPKFDRAAIMRRAWELHNGFYDHRGLPREFSRTDFAFYLSVAWNEAKQARMTPVQRRVEAIKAEIARLPYAPARIDIFTRQSALEAELSALAA